MFKVERIPKPNFSVIKNIRKDAIWGVVCYLYILVLIPLLFQRKDEFVQYHARQGLALLMVWVVFSFSFYLPVLPWILFLYILFNFITGIINVIRGRKNPLPLIGRFTENI